MTPNPSPAIPRLAAALAAVLALAGPHGARAAPERVVAIDTRPGVAIAFVVVEPEAKPVASAILFPGGPGKIKLWKRSPPNLGNNFLVRSRQLFARHGFLTALVDVASDQREDGLIGIRHTKEHRQDIAAVIAWLRERGKAPVWLIGTSRGTVSVAHLAAATRIEGAVLTAVVTESSRRRPANVMEARLQDIGVPVLLVNHRDDDCFVTPSYNLKKVRDRLVKSPKTDIMIFSGGRSKVSNPCQAMTHHGFLGIEDEVVGRIAEWIKARVKP